jgi:hypothetical protein
MNTANDLQPAHFTSAWSHLAVAVLVPLLVTSVYRLTVRYFHMRWLANRAVSTEEDEAMAAGVVEYAQDQSWAVRVDVHQLGTFGGQQKGWSWEETSRHTQAQPFYVAMSGGRRIRIEPDKKVVFADTLDGLTQHAENRRTRFAELSAGEQVWVHGPSTLAVDPELEHDAEGYRAAPRLVRIIRGTHKAPLMIATESPKREFLSYARACGVFACVTGALTTLFVLRYAAPFVDRALGTTEMCTVAESQPQYGVERKNYGAFIGWDFNCVIHGKKVSGFSRLERKVGTRIPARIGTFSSQLGSQATISTLAAAFTAMFLLFAMVIYVFVLGQFLQPWYRKQNGYALNIQCVRPSATKRT